MSWLRLGGNFGMHPKLMAVAGQPGADSRSVSEVRGFIAAIAAYSAEYLTDYFVDAGTCTVMAGFDRVDQVLQWCQATGLLTPANLDGVDGFMIWEDPDFIHIRAREDVEWERQRRRDNLSWSLKGPVLLRDGDQCRYCKAKVHWTGQVSRFKATLDHLEPGQAATVDTLVVACESCNASRKRDESGAWSERNELEDPPKHPIYGKWTRGQLRDHGYYIPSASVGAPGRTGDAVDPAPVAEGPATPGPGVDAAPIYRSAPGRTLDVVDSAPAAEGPATGGPGTPIYREHPGRRSGARVPEVVPGLVPNGVPDSHPPRSESPGSGLDGSGRVGTGLPGSGLDGSGRVGTGLPGSGLDGSGRDGTGPTQGNGKKARRRRRRRDRGRGVDHG